MAQLRPMLSATPPPRRTVIELQGLPGLQDIGVDGESFSCPHCGALLLERVEVKSVRHLLFRCPGCGGCCTLDARIAEA
jgi:predicted RNA-binding Zn-ribbon protein involved in translation (DUF1610 family)